jgi:hypothetical protein
MTMPGAEAHINAQSQDESHVMIDYFTDITLPIPTMVSAETQLYKTKAEPNYVSNHRDYDYNPESQLHCNLATMAINNRYDDEVVDGATNFQREIAVSTRSNPTDKSKPTESQSTKTHREVDRDVYREVDQDSTEAAYRERNHEVDQMVTEADFERRLPSQRHLPMTTD